MDIAALNLLETELRWSYTVFLSVLGRYLALKSEAGELDVMYAYARSCLTTFASWMLENEAPYFDHPEKLDYPTETWAAHELRKANVLRLGAQHADEPLRSRLTVHGNELAERAWSDLLRFKSRDVARAVAIMMVEGTRDAYFRSRPIEWASADRELCVRLTTGVHLAEETSPEPIKDAAGDSPGLPNTGKRGEMAATPLPLTWHSHRENYGRFGLGH